MESKANLRSKLKAERLKLTAREVQKRSQKITGRALEILNPPSPRLRGAGQA